MGYRSGRSVIHTWSFPIKSCLHHLPLISVSFDVMIGSLALVCPCYYELSFFGLEIQMLSCNVLANETVLT